MRRILLASIFAVTSLLAAGAESWQLLYEARLNGSSAWLEAKLALKTAEVAWNQFVQPLSPTVTIATSGSSGLGWGSGGFSGGLVSSLTFENLYGADLAIKAPLVAASSGTINFGDPSLSLTRKLFAETEADRLDAEAALIAARAAVRKAENSVRLALATEVLNAVYYKDLLEANQRDLAVLEKIKAATVDSTSLRELEKRILGARRSILAASANLSGIDQAIKKDIESLYGDVLRFQAEWTSSIDTDKAAVSLAVQALELSLAAAEKREAFSILPFLPNPNLTASLSYDLDKGEIGWGLGVTMSFTILDKGERSLAVLKREEYPKIYQARLADARRELSDAIRKARNAIATLELDRKIQELEIADFADEVKILADLFKAGYTNEENLVIAHIDVSIEQLKAKKIDYDIFIQKLNLAGYLNADE
ncbi:MAG: hypothetical protein CVV53_02895 [Spirochaetae bacterium HGW-Spirochaetae-9]|nr:MAG: hypothetical protein CVV53_02895 [Spirochaetae bacterium HGW-Spirochaetae-9]